MKRRLAAALLPLLAAAPAAAQSRVPGPSFEEVISLRSAGAPAVAPDGRSAVVPVRTTEWKENRYDTELWLARPGERPFRLTSTEKGSSTSPAWSPDGRWIAFLADRGEKQQLFLLRPSGGEAVQLTRSKEGVAAYRWSPDSRFVAFRSTEAESEEMRARRERYGDFAVEDAEFRQSHLWLVEVPAGLGTDEAPLPEPVRLTRGSDYTVGGFDWSPDGRAIAFSHQPDPLINSSIAADISVLEVSTRQVRPLVTGPGTDSNPVWSPDGRWILFSTAAGDTASHFYLNGKLARVAAEGGAPVPLAVGIDEDVNGYDWTAAGIVALVRQGTRQHLYLIDPANGRARQLSTSPENVSAFELTPDGRSLALLGQSAATLPEVYLSPLSGYRPVALTEMTRQMEGWEMGTAETISWTSTDGTRIEGVLHKPRGFDPSRKYPLLVVIHGGPTGVDFPAPVAGNVYPIPQWLAKGALVLRPNYRGSAGYGEKFRSLNVRNLGVGDAWDVLSGVDHLVREGVVDTTRMGAMGWSQGGYISAFLTTTSNRFRAISVGAGISDWMTYYVNTDIHPFTRQYLKATPWDDPEIYAKTSPITYIKQARTPTLIQHGELDRRVPIANAYELYQGLHDRGVPVRLVVYKGFGHGIDKPKERLAATWHNWQWFARHLWGEEVDLPLTEPTTAR